MQLTRDIFVLGAPVDTLALGPWLAFGQGDLHALESGEEVRTRLRMARLDPVAMPRLRAAFERWRSCDALDMGDDDLIDQVSSDIRRGRLCAILLRNAEQDLRPGATVNWVSQTLAGAAGRALGDLPVEGRVAEVLKRAVDRGRVVDRLGRWERLIEPAQRLNSHVAVLSLWTRNVSRGPAAVAEAFVAAKGVYVGSTPLYEAAAAFYAMLSEIGGAKDEGKLDKVAGKLVQLVRRLEVDGLLDILHLAATRGTDGMAPTPDRKEKRAEPAERKARPAPPPPAPPKQAGPKPTDASDGIEDGSAQAKTLKQAHKDGAPFCEKCT